MEKDDIDECPGMTGSVKQVSAAMIQSLGSTTAMGKDDNKGKGKHLLQLCFYIYYCFLLTNKTIFCFPIILR
jgi:hypothetical protein